MEICNYDLEILEDVTGIYLNRDDIQNLIIIIDKVIEIKGKELIDYIILNVSSGLSVISHNNEIILRPKMIHNFVKVFVPIYDSDILKCIFNNKVKEIVDDIISNQV